MTLITLQILAFSLAKCTQQPNKKIKNNLFTFNIPDSTEIRALDYEFTIKF